MPFLATAPHPAPLSLLHPCLTPRTLAPRLLASPKRTNESNVGQCRPLRQNPAPPALLEPVKNASNVARCGSARHTLTPLLYIDFRDVNKCTCFLAQRPAFTLNTPCRRSLRPAHQSAPAAQRCSEPARTLLDSAPKPRSCQPTRGAHVGEMWGSSPLLSFIVHPSSFIVPLRPAKPTHAFNPRCNPLP
jgi:hypothetical protein